MQTVDLLPLLSPYERHLFAVTQIIFAASLTLTIWEYLIFLPREWWILKNAKISPGTVALFINRYTGIISVIAGAVFIYSNVSDCRPAGWIILVGFAVQQTAASFIFLLRTRAIWSKNKYVTAVLSFGCVCVAGTWLASAWSGHSEAIPVPAIPYGGRCILGTETSSWRAISAASTTAYDIVVLLLTVSGLLGFAFNSGKSRAAQRTVRSLATASLVYFIPITIVNISAILLYVFAEAKLRTLALTYSFTASQIAASRLVFNMQSTFGMRDRSTAHGGEGVVHPSSSGGPKEINYSVNVESRVDDLELRGQLREQASASAMTTLTSTHDALGLSLLSEDGKVPATRSMQDSTHG